MFERSRVDTSRDMTAVAVKVELNDGRCIKGRFMIPRHKTLLEVLNGPTQFVDFAPFNGELEVISKSAISSLRMLEMPNERDPATQIRIAESFNPYEILGLDCGADRAAVRAAFHRQAKLYHPDRYSHVELPPEVLDYLAAKARRINAAYEALCDETTKLDVAAAD